MVPVRSRTRGAFTATPPRPCLDRTGRKIAVADDPPPPRLVTHLAILPQELLHFYFNGLCDQLLCSLAQEVGEHIPDFARHLWILQRSSRIVVHAAYSLLAKGG
jgi:hypothetical protein